MRTKLHCLFPSTLLSHILSTGRKYHMPLPYPFCLLYMCPMCTFNHSHDFKAPIQCHSLLTSISISLIMKCKINVRKREQINKLEFVTPNLSFSQDVSPAQDVFTQLSIGHCPRISAGHSVLSYPTQNLLFFQKPAVSFLPQASIY